MNRAALRAQFRSEADDAAAPYLFSDVDVNDWINQAEEEAAARADLLLDDSTLAVTQYALAAAASRFTLHSKITRVRYAYWLADAGGDPVTLHLIDRTELDRVRPSWRTDVGDTPEVLVLDNRAARVVPEPTQSGVVFLEAYRLPLVSMTDDAHVPEIADAHHRFLVDWALFRAYSKPDTETQDLARAGEAEARFEDRFGPRPDADMKQAGEVGPHVNKPWI